MVISGIRANQAYLFLKGKKKMFFALESEIKG